MMKKAKLNEGLNLIWDFFVGSRLFFCFLIKIIPFLFGSFGKRSYICTRIENNNKFNPFKNIGDYEKDT